MVPRVQRDSWAPAGDTTGFSVKMEEVAPAFLSLCPSSGHPVTRPSSNTTKVAKLRFEPRTLFTPSYSLKGGGRAQNCRSLQSFLFFSVGGLLGSAGCRKDSDGNGEEELPCRIPPSWACSRDFFVQGLADWRLQFQMSITST